MNFSAIPKNSLIGKILRFPLKLLPARLAVPIVQGPMRGMRWIVGSGDHGYWLGSYELAFQNRFAEVLRPGDVVLDIGAHVGYYTLLASRLVGPDGNVFAFEPLPRNATYIERHIRINRLENVTLSQLAISDRTGTAHFGGGVSSSTGRIDMTGDLEVDTASLDDLLQTGKIAPPNVLKIDVEGAEMDVLAGGQETIRSGRPVIFLATHGADQHGVCLKFLRSFGYALQPLNADGVDQASEILALPSPDVRAESE
ncbi:MAG: FkbM family methyltransferase [Anaerolineales bacterium]|nr:FkbM family methyltransferase [Anaerolineales bacterium]